MTASSARIRSATARDSHRNVAVSSTTGIGSTRHGRLSIDATRPSARTGRSCTRWPAPSASSSRSTRCLPLGQPHRRRATRRAARPPAATSMRPASSRHRRPIAERDRQATGTRHDTARPWIAASRRAIASCTRPSRRRARARRTRSAGPRRAPSPPRRARRARRAASAARRSTDRDLVEAALHRPRERRVEQQEAHHRLAVDRAARRALVHLQGRQRAQHAHPLHLVGQRLDPGRLHLQQRRGTHTEHAGRHVGALDHLPEPEHPVRVLPRHRRVEHAVEAPAVVDDPGEEAIAGAGVARRSRRRRRRTATAR